MLQHQALQHTVNSPLVKAKGEILRIIESLTEKQYQDVVDLMLSVSAQTKALAGRHKSHSSSFVALGGRSSRFLPRRIFAQTQIT